MAKKKPSKSSSGSKTKKPVKANKPAAKTAAKAKAAAPSRPAARAQASQPATAAKNPAVAPSAAPQKGALPQVSIAAQYVKDLSFENPNAPRILSVKTAPKVDVNVDLRASALNTERTTFEVLFKIHAKASHEQGVAFLVELTYGGVFTLMNIPQKDMETTLLVYCPNLLFPFARQAIASATRDGGFPPLLLDPIDFGALYVQRRRAAQQQGGGQPN